jgi:hypothetical protein
VYHPESGIQEAAAISGQAVIRALRGRHSNLNLMVKPSKVCAVCYPVELGLTANSVLQPWIRL